MSKKKIMALLLAATMVMGSSITVFAEGEVVDPPAATKSGGTDGAGTSEGHVEKEVLNMVLPTIPAGTTPFAYTMDPERLIQETQGAKYTDYTFPAKASDTGVYFKVGDKEYANTSNTLQAINKSSCDVTLTVKVKATASGSKDIKLAENATPASGAEDDPELYLGLTVGKTSKVVSATEETVTKTIAGTAGNFETVYKDSAYAYQEKADATTWKAINISMTGAVSSKAIASDTTAPTVNVTWSYDKAANGATVDTADQVDYSTTPAASAPAISNITAFDKADPADVVITFTAGSGDKEVDFDGVTLLQGSGKTAVNITKYTVNQTAKTVTIDKTAGFMTSATDDVPVYVVLTKGGTTVKELTGTITIQ